MAATKLLPNSLRQLQRLRQPYQSYGCRRFFQSTSDSSGSDVANILLSEPIPGLPTPVYAKVNSDIYETKVTTLSNGIRVASEKKFGQFCTVGVVIDSGSRYEVAYPSGVSHFLEKLAFNSTLEYKNRDSILKELEQHGGICDCQSSRDTMIYAASAESKGMDKVVQLLADVVLRPKLTEDEVNTAATAIRFELEDLDFRPEKEFLLTEMIHAAAYQNNTLGLPKLCPDKSLAVMNRQTLYTYLKHHYTPSRMVVAGVGVEHDQLVEQVQRQFVEKSPIWESEKSLVGSDVPVDQSISQYTGGVEEVRKDLSEMSLGPTPHPELAHFVLGLESCSHQDPDFIVFCVLNMMMGGGGSFSAGGPGKGMYTRLYTNVLNRFHWMYNATAYNHAYTDTGLFCVLASAHPSHLKELVDVIVKEFVSMAGAVGKVELERAKIQLQSLLWMNLESRPVMFEDIGRQVLATGHRRPAAYFIDQIGKITADDIQRVAAKMLQNKPAVAAMGKLETLPKVSYIQEGLHAAPARARGFSLFR